MGEEKMGMGGRVEVGDAAEVMVEDYAWEGGWSVMLAVDTTHVRLVRTCVLGDERLERTYHVAYVRKAAPATSRAVIHWHVARGSTVCGRPVGSLSGDQRMSGDVRDVNCSACRRPPHEVVEPPCGARDEQSGARCVLPADHVVADPLSSHQGPPSCAARWRDVALERDAGETDEEVRERARDEILRRAALAMDELLGAPGCESCAAARRERG